jgi:hypothetical protein
MTTKETGLSFLEFCKAELVDLEAAAARGEPGMAEQAATLWRILETAAVGRAAVAAAEYRTAPKHYSKARPSLADFDSAGGKWGNA